jgi:hypothetical protein
MYYVLLIFEIYVRILLLRVCELLSFKFVMFYCVVKPWQWQFLFILIGMICLKTYSINYGYITGSGLFESSINEWMNQIYRNKFWPRQTPRHIILLILDYYQPKNNNFYSNSFLHHNSKNKYSSATNFHFWLPPPPPTPHFCFDAFE